MPSSIRGISGMGNIGNIPDYNIIKLHVGLWRFRLQGKDVNPTAGVYTYTSFESSVDLVTGDGLYFFFQISNGPANVTPAFYFTPPYNVPLVTPTSGAQAPYYLDANYISLKAAMIDNLRTRIKNVWGSGRKTKLVCWQSTESKTGDEGSGIETVSSVTINGVVQPNPSLYAISSTAWTNYKRTSVWLQFQAALQADIPTCLLAINPSNDATNWPWALTNIANVVLKAGQVSHNYNNVGEYFYALRINALTATIPNNMVFGEFENLDSTTWFQISTRQNMFAQICSFMTHGGTSLNIAPSTFNNVININNATDWWMFDFANEVMGIRNTSDSNQAWIVFKDTPDGTDLARFPENIYGPVVAASQVNAYNTKYQAITNSTDSQEVKNDKYAALLLQYFNDTRRILIGNSLPNLSILTLDGSLDHDAYHQDFNIYALGNYGRFMTQYNPANTSTGYARIGATNQPHGRFCRIPNPEISVAIDSGLVGDFSYNVTFDIWYYNEGSRSWSLNYYNGSTKTVAETIVNTGTNAWVQKTITISNFNGGGNLSNSTDWTLKTESGSGTKFELVKLTVNYQNINIQPIAGIIDNSLVTICGLLSEPFYTIGAFGIGKIVYSDVFATIPINKSFFVEVNTGTIYNVNPATGELLSLQGSSCGIGVQGIYILGNSIGSICGGTPVVLYTASAFAPGQTLAYNTNLFTEVTGFTYVVNTVDSKIYNLNSVTGLVGTDTTINCMGSGISGLYRTGNSSSSVCGITPITLYTDGAFAADSILFTDQILSTPATGFAFVVAANNFIYSVNSGTGQVIAQVGICNGGTSGTYKLGNDITTVCNASNVTRYTNGSFAEGGKLYTDANLINVQTGNAYVVQGSTSKVFNLNTSTGVIGSLTAIICGNGKAVHGKKKA